MNRQYERFKADLRVADLYHLENGNGPIKQWEAFTEGEIQQRGRSYMDSPLEEADLYHLEEGVHTKAENVTETA